MAQGAYNLHTQKCNFCCFLFYRVLMKNIKISFAGYMLSILQMRAAPEVMPPTLFCSPTISEEDGSSMEVGTEPSY